MKAVAIADRGRIDGAQTAARLARRLKSQGRLPRDFEVITGQIVATTAGTVLALFAHDIIPSNMTIRKTVEQIHRDGGLAYLVHPAMPGAPQRLRKFAFDGYMIQPGVFETYRSQPLQGDPRLAGKPAIAGSNSIYGATAGLPYTMLDIGHASGATEETALRAGNLYEAVGVYLPWMTITSEFKPVATFVGILNQYFRLHGFAETRLANALGADSITITTTWDDEIRDIMDLTGLPRGVRDILDGSSPLRHRPRLGCIAAEYSYWRVGYDNPSNTAFAQAVFTW